MNRGGVSFISDSIAIIIIAGLLSLLPVVVLLWIYYVRERKPSVSGASIARFFAVGMLSTGGAVALERSIYGIWKFFSPGTAETFFAENVQLTDFASLVVAAIVSFGMIALVEEGVRYVCMRLTFSRKSEFDQLIDGVQFGTALGLGFAFIENTLYFFQLFRGLDFGTLVVVFFLRFLISTVGHMSFGGIMGYLLAMGRIFPAEQKKFLRLAFFLPWLMHGFFDYLLTIQLSFYTVLLLLIPLFVFWTWSQDERMFEIHVLRGRRLRFPVASRKQELLPSSSRMIEVLPSMNSCPNCYAPLAEKDKQCASCGLRLHRRGLPPPFPFLTSES